MRFIYTKGFLIFSAFFLVIIIMAALFVTGRLGKVKKAFLNAPRPAAVLFKKTTLPVKDFFVSLYQLGKIAQENTALKDEIVGLQKELAELDKEKRDNETLRKELNFVQNIKQPVVTCNVLSQGVSNFTDTINLGCGTQKGVIEGQAVVSGGFLAGKIIHSEKEVSTALLITGSKFLADAELSKTGAQGIVKGSFNSGLSIDQLPSDTVVEPGWLVVTAGINEKIPKNLLIGEIRQIISSPDDLFKKATVISPIDFNNLELVSIMQ